MQDKMKTESIASGASAASVEGHFAPVYRVLTEAIAARAFPGCAFGVFADGNVVLQDALGRSTYDSDAFEVAPNTIYDIASITKVVATTASAMLLAQRGVLDLDTSLGELLPDSLWGGLLNSAP